MIGNYLKIEEFKEWVEHFNKYDAVMPRVRKVKCGISTYFELFRGKDKSPYIQSKHYDNGYIDRMERAGKLFEYNKPKKDIVQILKEEKDSIPY